jgi:hypothetical protein
MDPATARSSSNSWTTDELLLAAARRGPSEKTATITAHSSSEVIFMNNTGLSYAREGDFV